MNTHIYVYVYICDKIYNFITKLKKSNIRLEKWLSG